MTATGQIGQYRILRKIGVGGMGMVFSGEHLLIQRRAAIKILLPELSRRPEIVDRFFNEARATSAIGDPGIVQVFDFGYHVDGTAYIVMELLEGEGLADRLDRLGTLPIQAALRIARQVASSLAAAHAKGIVHRDLKPENIFLIRDCEAQGGERTKILDFGICAVAEAPETAAPAEAMIGTPIYMAPEQCRGGGHGDPRSDIYGLGCVLFQMLTGQAPFERDTVSEVIQAHLVEPPPPPSALREDVPALGDELVQRCLAKAPEDRFPSMTELGAALEHALALLSAPAPPVFELPLAMPLDIGFRSMFDTSAATYDALAEPAEPAEPPGASSRTMDAVVTVVAVDVVGAVGAERRGGPLRRAALGLALLGGAILASFAARLTDGDDALARAAMAPAPSVIAPAATAGPAPAPRAARADTAEPAPRSPARAGAAPAGAAPAAAAPASHAPAAPRAAGHAPANSRPAPPARPRRAVPPPAMAAPASAPAPTPVAPSEDLYDMR